MRAVRLANPKSITISDEIVNKTSYLPNPDAFTMALFSRLMGPKVLRLELNVSTSAGVPNATEMLRGYAHCARGGGGATLLLINLASATDFDVAVGDASAELDGRIALGARLPVRWADGGQPRRSRWGGRQLARRQQGAARLPPRAAQPVFG